MAAKAISNLFFLLRPQRRTRLLNEVYLQQRILHEIAFEGSKQE